MWLTIAIVIALGLGLVIALFGGGPIGFFVLAVALVGLVGKLIGAYAGQGRSGAEHRERGERLRRGEPTGHAHEGQRHMTPEQTSTQH